jgi:hypothetical protein
MPQEQSVTLSRLGYKIIVGNINIKQQSSQPQPQPQQYPPLTHSCNSLQ